MLKTMAALVRLRGVQGFLNLPRFFCSEFTIDPFLEHYAEISLRQPRRLYLNRSVLNQSKDVTFAEMRQHNDGFLSLKQKGRCAGVIERLSGIPDE
jgi:hypothetical protein